MAHKVALTPKEKFAFYCDHSDMAIEVLMSKLSLSERSIKRYKGKLKKMSKPPNLPLETDTPPNTMEGVALTDVKITMITLENYLHRLIVCEEKPSPQTAREIATFIKNKDGYKSDKADQNLPQPIDQLIHEANEYVNHVINRRTPSSDTVPE